ncbi:antibiotic biosynthesis monooxygenase family protein [Mucilaginibacter antarcticus]|uniref:antibiotic biosynthesis monooxygenase family protein n=1 Tax=Mucilaginibacter antarcticus TaxID=1855725 RepID=UPI003643C77C
MSKEDPKFTFINIWDTADTNKQGQLLEAMKEDAQEIQKQHGFIGMAFYASSDGRQTVVYAQWETEEDFNKGIVQNPVMTAGRDKLSAFGDPAPNTYTMNGIFFHQTEKTEQ